MFAGLYSLIVSFVVAAVVYYLSTLVPSAIVQKLGMAVAVIIAVIGLLAFLRPFLGA